jgi:OHCU decarboxylase
VLVVFVLFACAAAVDRLMTELVSPGLAGGKTHGQSRTRNTPNLEYCRAGLQFASTWWCSTRVAQSPLCTLSSAARWASGYDPVTVPRRHAAVPELTVDDLNAMSREQYLAAIGFLFEHSPWIVEAAWEQRPFASRDDLQAKLIDVVRRAPLERRIALIQAHPDLAGRAALAGDLTEASTREQASAGLDRLSPDDYLRFHELNNAYKARFGFPFIICVRENTKESILRSFETRLLHEREAEVATALDEIGKIVRLRLADAVAP